MLNRFVVACDPGGRETGLVAVDAGQVLAFEVLVREGDGDLPDKGYLDRVAERYREYIDLCPERPLRAVEGLVKPTPQMGYTSVMALVGTGMVFGVVLARFGAVVVRPGGHGKHDLRAYPPELQPTRGQGKGTDVLRHARSAYDIALAGRKVRLQ